MDINKNVGERIALSRIKRGLTQEELSKVLGIRRDKLAKWEAGLITIKIQDVISVANVLNVTSDYLLGLQDVMSMDSDIQSISNYTGLDEYAINKLHENNTLDNIVRIISSDIICRDIFWDIVRDCAEIKRMCRCLIVDRNKEYLFPGNTLVSICKDLNISEQVFLEYLRSHKAVVDKIKAINLCIDGLKYDINKSIEKYTEVCDDRKRLKFTVEDLCSIFEISQDELKDMQNRSH